MFVGTNDNPRRAGTDTSAPPSLEPAVERSWRPDNSAPPLGLGVLVGAGLLACVVALYGTTMAHSFVAGDSARYLSLAHTGALSDRGNGLPLYVTLLNAMVHLPLPYAVTDGIRANLLTVLLAAGGIVLAYAAALRLTRSILAAAIAAGCLTLSGLIWSSTTWIMPHVGMLVPGALFVLLLVAYDHAPSPRRGVELGLVCGVGFGLLPNALLFAPVAVGYAALRRTGRAAWTDAAATALGVFWGIAFNAALIAAHESWSPTFAIEGRSVWSATLLCLRGGQETQWLVGGLTPAAVRGLVTLPLEIAADFEFVGTLLVFAGLVIGLRTRPRLHFGLLAAFVIFSAWSGVYPGDTRLLHGLGAYPIAGAWLAVGAHAVILRGRAWSLGMRALPGMPSLHGLGWAALLAVLLLGNLAAGKLLYREALCASGRWYLAGFCRERVPESVGDLHLRRAEAAIERIPEGALVFGAAWDAADQMRYLIAVRASRPDLVTAYDLTKFEPTTFLRLAEPAWRRGQPVFLFGEWRDVELWSPQTMQLLSAAPRGPMVFELFPANAAPDTGGAERSP